MNTISWTAADAKKSMAGGSHSEFTDSLAWASDDARHAENGMKTLLVTGPPRLSPRELDLDKNTLRWLANLHDRIVRSVMKNCLGRRVGRDDGSYQMLFDRPDHAVSFALTYFRALEKLSSGENDADLISGVGIHHGAEWSQGREIARELASLAGSRRILLTQDAFDLARPVLEVYHGVCWQAHDDCEVEGLPEPLVVFEAFAEPADALMGSEVESDVEKLLHEALQLPLEKRQGFLVQACGDDADLRREVASLIQADENAGRFLVRSILARGTESSTLFSGISSISQLGLLGRLPGHFSAEATICQRLINQQDPQDSCDAEDGEIATPARVRKFA